MSGPIFSSSWHLVAGLKPRLRSHAQIHRHVYRGQLWYVLQDSLSGRFHRFTPAAYDLIARMDGRTTVQTLWDQAVGHLGDEAPTQDELIGLLAQLHGSDVLLCDVAPDGREVFQRFRQQDRQRWLQRLSNPMSVRIPLFDPDPFLNRWQGGARRLFSGPGLLVWLAAVGSAVVQAAMHWEALTANVTDTVLAPSNLVIMLLVYPVIKLLHEFGHALATKAFGGVVHEMGIMLLVLMPVPYVDASAASAFRDKYRRMVVGAAGMLVELFLAALALWVWLNAEPGLTRAIAYNVVLIGSVSTLFFNGNPLLRFDGYYIFADAIEMPNLGARANQYLGYLTQRYLFGVQDLKPPSEPLAERLWLGFYGVAAFAYRIVVLVSIALFVAQEFFFIGIVLALWGLTTGLGLPIWKGLRFLAASPVIQRRRLRAQLVSAVLLAALAGAVLLLPVPSYTHAEGVVWLPEQSQVRAATGGFIRRILAEPDSEVIAGTPLFLTDDPLLEKEKAVVEQRLREAEIRYKAYWREDLDKAQQIQEEIAALQTELQRVLERRDNLIIRSPVAGRFVAPNVADSLDKWLHQGDVVAYVVQHPVHTVRVAVTQDRIGLVRQRTRKVEVRLAEDIPAVYRGVIEREIPAALAELPSAALGKAGGGSIANDPSDAHGSKAFETIFQFDLRIIDCPDLAHIGGRVHVRFEHGGEPLAKQGYRLLRQLFLRRFSV